MSIFSAYERNRSMMERIGVHYTTEMHEVCMAKLAAQDIRPESYAQKAIANFYSCMIEILVRPSRATELRDEYSREMEQYTETLMDVIGSPITVLDSRIRDEMPIMLSFGFVSRHQFRRLFG